MLNHITQILLITLSTIIVVDKLHFIDNIWKSFWSIILNKPRSIISNPPKPFSCSLCLSFWLTGLYLYNSSELSFISIISIALLNSYAINIYTILFDIVFDSTLNIFTTIYNKINS